ncbi:hypothetical protein ACLOJK_009310 [Asimina triloba]
MAFVSWSSSSLFFFSFLFCLSLAIAQLSESQDPRSHGLGKESPVAFSPEAFEFFHPNSSTSTIHDPCNEPDCTAGPLPSVSGAFADPLAAQVSERAEPGKEANRSGIGAGGIVGIVFGSALVVLLAMGAYYAVVTRRANVDRENSAVRLNV